MVSRLLIVDVYGKLQTTVSQFKGSLLGWASIKLHSKQVSKFGAVFSHFTPEINFIRNTAEFAAALWAGVTSSMDQQQERLVN